MYEEGRSCGQALDFVRANKPRAGITAEGVKFAAKAFSPTTACTDGYRQRRSRCYQQSCWIAMPAWAMCGSRRPSSEQVVHSALIPKPTGGERPIGLFRSIVWVVCKVAAWDGLAWFDAQDIPQLNTSKGRRIGDTIWRAQMRSQIACTKHVGEIMIDLLKPFEYVDRTKLAEAGSCSKLGNVRF